MQSVSLAGAADIGPADIATSSDAAVTARVILRFMVLLSLLLFSVCPLFVQTLALAQRSCQALV